MEIFEGGGSGGVEWDGEVGVVRWVARSCGRCDDDLFGVGQG